MPIELVSISGKRFYFSNHQWEETLLLAKEYGWMPLDAPAEPWERYYFSSDGYAISARDAEALAAALRLACRAVPSNEQAYLRQFIAFCQSGEFRVE
ncbi:MAG: hypothetical protein RMI34_06470 [Chloroherpetonaceae bacterium]|nr:hypothetical protein [Chloroherpetonaceae bacterium]MCS7211283.1 hypothetical protein [Chloroherpetonaceae bacterium]MDW8019703.1 hypothetical protein [Chloroherpetonaceae bacterium]